VDTSKPAGKSYLCVPILGQGEAFGILHFQGMDARVIAESEISVAASLAEQVGLAVANIRLREALRAQSVRDPLTGLYNRRYLDETLEREIRRSARSDQPVSILMLDVDHFKRFNDTYGHDAGDMVLRDTGTLLTASIRSEDFACRFGGEEFVVVLPTATLEVAQARAERLRLRLHELALVHQGRPLGRVTTSIGVAEFPMA
jgi:diguanylate cyclase (GGDEF)-like protein